MRYRVKLKTTVTAWVEVEVDTTNPDLAGYTAEHLAELAADDAVDMHGYVLADPLRDVGLAHGPIGLAYEELDESVEVIA